MKEITIEVYRKIAAELRKGGVPVTKSAIATRLARSRATVSNTIERISWRRQYVGVVHRLESVAAEYRKAALELTRDGELVSTTTLARKLGRTARAVQLYLRRNECVFDGLAIKVERQHRYIDAATRYREAAERMKAAGHPMTRKSLAIELRVRYSAVTFYLERHPELAQELGIVYTSQLKR